MVDSPLPAPEQRVLATDLDGTLIPLDGNQQNQADLQVLATEMARRRVIAVYVTGRHFESVLGVMEAYQLPRPAWIICDVGTTICRRGAAGRYEPVEEYARGLERIVGEMPIDRVRDLLASAADLRLQEQEKQGRFKLSYYVDATRVKLSAVEVQTTLATARAPYSIIASVDPFTGDGLIDVLPAQVSKAFALDWWVRHVQMAAEAVVFAGDSGNDLAALTAGYRAIVVGNADPALAAQVARAHQQAGFRDRLHLARAPATSGVLEGCRRFGLCD